MGNAAPCGLWALLVVVLVNILVYAMLSAGGQ